MVKGGLLAHVALCNQYAIVAGAHIYLRFEIRQCGYGLSCTVSYDYIYA